MASQNDYLGSAKLLKKESYQGTIRLDFNGQINCLPGGTKLEGFSLRLSVPKKNVKDDQPEITVNLRPEEWLDLIDAMKEEFESVSKARKNFDEMR